MKVLVVNVGSTSLKFKLFAFEKGKYRPEDMVAEGKIEGIGQKEATFKFLTAQGFVREGVQQFVDYASGIQAIIEFLLADEARVLRSLTDLDAIGFKTVHCGFVPEGAVMLDEAVLKKMEEFSPVAPSHNPPYIRAIRTFKELLPDKPVIGLFEPTFHRTMPQEAVYYGVPLEWREEYGIQRYGFHGASHRYIAERTPQILGCSPQHLRLISCHLGGSSSLCAIKNGRSIDTSMGFSPQSGILHSTRPDDLDPFVVLYLMKKKGWTPDEAINMLNKECGLKGVSGLGTGEFKVIESAAKSGNTRAQLAVDIFIYEIRKFIGAYIVALEGIDALVFTGGIGERSAYVRERVCRNLGFLGINLDAEKNAQTFAIEKIINTEDSPVKILVVPTNEEYIVARSAAELLEKSTNL